jgi:aminopeptidase N
MEHQSAVAYGNKYKNGYLGMDRSRTGWGMKFDFIIIHESGHEWFANNITAKDVADMWIHEGFTTYSETLFVECEYGLQAANQYVQGQRRNIRNNTTIIGAYGVNKEGSSDMYDKGANMIHTIRQIINNDSAFRQLLRDLNKDFYHQTVTTQQIEKYIIQKTGKKLDKIFDQYLRSTKIPVLEYEINNDKISYRWANCVADFDMPVKLTNGVWLQPTTVFQTKKINQNDFIADPNFYIKVEEIKNKN